MKKRLLFTVSLIMILMLLLGLSSCKQEGEDETATDATTASSATALKLIENGALNATIVYQANSSAQILDAVDMIKKEFSESYGVEVSAITDTLHTADDDKLEILIGKTKHDASVSASEALEKNTYSVSVVDNKIIIAASHEYLFPIAAEHFVSSLSSSESTVSIECDYKHTSSAFDSITIFDSGKKTEYDIVYDSESAEALAAATKIKETFSKLRVSIDLVPDSESEGDKEILIGKTNRDLSYETEAYYMKAQIDKDKNGNIAITGNLSHGASLFVDYLNTLGYSDDGVSIIEPMFGIFDPKGVGMAPLYEGGGEPKFVKGFEPSNSYSITVRGASRSDYNEYVEVLKSNGFKQHVSKTVNGNIFETYTDGYSILTMAHISYIDPATTEPVTASPSLGPVKYISIAVDCIDNSALPICEESVEQITTPQMTTVHTVCGYVFRLSDGRFVVFDGGVSGSASYIYEIITKQNEREGKPVIAAWLISHFHADHIDAAKKFMMDYSKQVEIETFIYNIPGDEIYIDKNTAEGANNTEDTKLKARGLDLYKCFASYYPNIQVVVAHAGQQFRYGDFYIDVLWTAENLYGKQMYDTNMSSVCYSFTGKSGRMIVLGDQQEYGCAMMNAIYGQTLKCDLVQIAHHGYNGGDEDMYASMDATYAIWPNDVVKIKSDKLHYDPSYGRNLFDYTTVDANLATTDGGKPITLYEGMTREEILALDIGLTH